MSLRPVSSLLLLAVLAGCGAGATVSQVDRSPGAANEVRVYLATRPEILVAGTPPDGSGPEAVAAGLRAPASQGGATFRLAAPGTDPVMRVGFGVDAGGLCRGAAGATQPAGGQLAATVAYCRGDQAYASAQLTSAQLAGPSSPGFDSAFANLFARMAQDKPRGGGGGK